MFRPVLTNGLAFLLSTSTSHPITLINYRQSMAYCIVSANTALREERKLTFCSKGVIDRLFFMNPPHSPTLFDKQIDTFLRGAVRYDPTFFSPRYPSGYIPPG